ncbi:lysozyme inhibitor LprI family protein [Eleftheria terrae]|uniref:lysozyme inhibitor LprI family protein n=1 Tax=Eleftheria terrae TaxID=1597781 RepID=UPI00263BE53D|nr:lysozyme inhibitor LprI family protein [Eleftheria terrae]WKB52272.1 lysozyme inhibitor LprI family protein [Eleftheria terrae]
MLPVNWKATLACLLYLLHGLASAGELAAEPDTRQACGHHSQAGMRDCLAALADDSTSALRQAEARAQAALQRWDEDARYVAAATARLAAAARAFGRYREAQCGWAASLRGGAAGNAREITRLACVVELNRGRVRQLDTAMAPLPAR